MVMDFNSIFPYKEWCKSFLFLQTFCNILWIDRCDKAMAMKRKSIAIHEESSSDLDIELSSPPEKAHVLSDSSSAQSEVHVPSSSSSSSRMGPIKTTYRMIPNGKRSTLGWTTIQEAWFAPSVSLMGRHLFRLRVHG